MKNNVLRKVFALLLSLLLAFAFTATAAAVDSSVTYNDSRMIVFAPDTGYPTDLFADLKGVMPGDTRTQTITIENQNTEFDYLKVYLRAVPHGEENAPTVEGLTVEDSNGFLSQLSLTVLCDGTEIYSDSPDQPGALASGVFLGQIASSETITLEATLEVPTTLDNEFADRIGEVDWVFTFEGYDLDVLTVRKIWTGDTSIIPDSVQVQLLRNNEVFETQTLSNENQWTYTWADLDQDFTWDVKEVEMENCFTEYTREGNEILIENYIPGFLPPDTVHDRDLTVVKRWDVGGKPHPDSVTVTLYNGSRAVDRVTLSDANNWTYTWKNLHGSQWRVVETNINSGYVPWYSTSGEVVTITNAQRLIQTGQMSWPVPVLSVLGVLLIAGGAYITFRKRKRNRA